jgi:SAM-dependent methyltransferase
MNYKSKNLVDLWNEQYKSSIDTALKDSYLFKLEFDAIFEAIKDNLKSKKKIKILELGCGTGFLISNLIDKLGELDIDVIYEGVDFSADAIKNAKKKKIKNINFFCEDFIKFLVETNSCYDFIITQRSIMALMELKKQDNLLELIKIKLSKTGVGVFSECFEEQLNNLNKLRKIMGLENIQKVWHSLYLKKNQLERYFNDVKYKDFCSTYFFVTRVIYPFFEIPLHNQEIHNRASMLPNYGDVSFLRLAIVKN